MPFTLAHPAIVIPLYKKLKSWGVLSALIIGSMVPDFSYFIPLGIGRYETHTLFALLWYCLPMGLLFYYLYHGLLFPVLYSLLPTSFRQRLATKKTKEKRSFFAIVFCLLIGAMSHLMWDFFTHYPDNVPTYVADNMTYVVARFNGYTLNIYRLLQHTSTLLGIGFIIYWIRGWYIHTSPIPQPKNPKYLRGIIRLIFITIPISSGVIAAYLSTSYLIETNQGSALYKTIMATRDMIIYGGQAFIITWIVLGVIYFIYQRTHYSREA
ncbi:MAG: DUF4184 family protein [Thiotrichaceae bacterium]|nr:DUF4184 family protein [Thiotrichaceae bacterium]